MASYKLQAKVRNDKARLAKNKRIAQERKEARVRRKNMDALSRMRRAR